MSLYQENREISEGKPSDSSDFSIVTMPGMLSLILMDSFLKE